MDASYANLQSFIDALFQRYDTEGTGSLGVAQLKHFANDLFALSGQQRNVSNEEVLSAFKSLDSDQNRRVEKSEMFNAFKWMTNTQYLPPTRSQTENNASSIGWGNNDWRTNSQPTSFRSANQYRGNTPVMGNSCPLPSYGWNDPTWNVNRNNFK